MKQKLIDGEYVTIEEIIQKHKGYVYKQIARYNKEGSVYGLTRDDLFQAGCIGLIKAFENYKESNGNKFITYASQYISGYIKRDIANTNHLIRLPKNLYDLVLKIKAEGWDDKPVEFIAEEMNLTVTRVKTALYHLDYFIGSTDKNIITDENKEMNVLDFTSDGEDITEEVLVKEFLNLLNGSERMVLTMRLQGYRITEIGGLLGKSRSYGYVIMQGVKEKYQKHYELPV